MLATYLFLQVAGNQSTTYQDCLERALSLYYLSVLTKREELLFLTVLALPYASSTGLAWII